MIQNRLLRRALRQIDEWLVRQVFDRQQPLGNLFFTPFTLKQRIQMLQKTASSRWALLRYAAILPLSLLLWMCTQKEAQPTGPPTQEAEKKLVDKALSSLSKIGYEGEVLNVVEQQPEYPGGIEGLRNYLSSNLRYPAKSAADGITGRVFVRFVVGKDGSINDVEILKGLNKEIDQEAIRVMYDMPHWKPAQHEGKVVNVRFNLPIHFQLDDKAPSNSGETGSLPPLPPPPPKERS